MRNNQTFKILSLNILEKSYKLASSYLGYRTNTLRLKHITLHIKNCLCSTEILKILYLISIVNIKGIYKFYKPIYSVVTLLKLAKIIFII